MKKIVSIVIAAIFFGQSLLTSYLYAAEPTPAKATQQSSQSANQQLIDRFIKMDLSSVDTISILQIAAYLYVYHKNGIAGFDFEKGELSQAMTTVNYFITSYAPNVGFLANDNGDGSYFSDKANVWKTAYPEEYNKVYVYAKDMQLKYAIPAAPVAAPAPIPADGNTQPKVPAATVPTPANTKPSTAVQATKFGESCDAMYTKLMKEYESLIIIKDVEYAKIADVKQRIAAVQQGKGCTVAAAVATQQEMQEENQAVIAQVRKTLNFGSANMKVIPENILPAYCEDVNANELRNQLLDIDGQTIRSMKTDLDSLIQSEELGDSLIKRNVLNFVSQELGLVDSVQSTQQGDATSVFHNMIQGLILVGDSVANSRGVHNMIEIASANMDKFNEIGRFIGEEFDGIKALKTKGNSDYSWDKDMGTFTRTQNSDGVIRFKLPASKDATNNNAVFTIATARTKSIQVSQKPYIWTQYQGDISLEQFAQEAKNNGSMWGNQMDASTLGKELTQEIIAYAPDYYTYNDPSQPTVFFAEANGEQKVFKDANLIAVMPVGKFSNPRGTTYVIGENGKLEDMYYNEEAPENVRMKLDVDGKLVAGVDLSVAYDEQAIRSGYGSSFPLKVTAKVYIADYLFTFNAERVLNQSTWSLSINIGVQGSTICQFSLSAAMDYQHDDKEGYPSIQDDQTNIIQGAAKLSYNDNLLTINISDAAGFVSSASSAISSSVDGDVISALLDPVQQYISAAYYFDNNKLADILPDVDAMVVVQYENSGVREPIMDIVSSYVHLLRMDTIMQFVQSNMGKSDKEYTEETPVNTDDGSQSDEGKDNQVPTVYDPVLKVNNYYQDGQYLYVSHIYYDTQGNGSQVQPDGVSIEVTTDAGPVSYQLDMVDMYLYGAPVAHILTDLSVSSAYIHASYNGYESTYPIVAYNNEDDGLAGSGDVSGSGEAPQNLYTMQGQSTSYPDVQTQEIVLSLYDNGSFVQYVEPTIILNISYGQDCRSNPDMCTYSNNTMYPTYLSGIPTYIIDTMQLDDVSVYEASVSITYMDPLGYEHNEKYGLKKPLQ